MFKKLLSALTVMLFVFGMNASAQDLQKAVLGKVMPKFAAKNVVTSKVDVAADEFWTGYWNGEVNDNTQLIGVQKIPVDYGCAISYPAGSAITAGKTIKGIKFLFADHKNIGNVKIFISTKPISKASDADICFDDVKDITSMQVPGDDYMNEVRFSKPYEVDPAKPVYIGYFFSVTGGNGDYENFPVCIQKGPDKKNALLLSFGGEPMQDYFGNNFGVIAMQVLMSGTFEDNDVAIAGDLGNVTASKNTFELPVTVENSGNKGIENLEVVTDVNGVVTTSEVKAPKKVEGIGKPFAFNININTPAETGSYDFSVKITKINGVDATREIVGKGKMTVISKIVPHKVVVEEFTGMWCGWCPRGMVALQKLHKTFGENVVCLAVHKGDALESKDYSKVGVAGYPSAIVDRTIIGVDPLFGSGMTSYGIKDDVSKLMEIVPVVEIVSKPVYDGKKLSATSEATFLYTGDASNYAIAYVLIEDGMENNSWRQSNYYSGRTESDPLFEPWTSGKSKVAGVIFNEVVIAAKGIENGLANSIPAEVTEDVTVSHSVEFDLSKYKAIQDTDKLSVATIVFDTTTGKMVNADLKPVKFDNTGIEDVEGTDNLVETARYTIDGRRINKPEAGVNIVKYSNGTVKKVIVK